MEAPKKSRRIPMRKIENKQYRMVAFSKRRRGLFSKAKRLQELTGSEIAVLVFSEAGRPYLHGSPATLDRFLSESGVGGGEEESNANAKANANANEVGGFESESKGVGVEEWIDGVDRTLTQGELKLEDLGALRREAEDIRECLAGRLRYMEEDRFIGSLLCDHRRYKGESLEKVGQCPAWSFYNSPESLHSTMSLVEA